MAENIDIQLNTVFAFIFSALFSCKKVLFIFREYNVFPYEYLSVYNSMQLINLLFITFIVDILYIQELNINIDKKVIFKNIVKTVMPFQLIIVLLKIIPRVITHALKMNTQYFNSIDIIKMLSITMIGITGYFIIAYAKDENTNFWQSWRKSFSLIKVYFKSAIKIMIVVLLINLTVMIINIIIENEIALKIADYQIKTNLRFLLGAIFTIISGYNLTLIISVKLIFVNSKIEEKHVT